MQQRDGTSWELMPGAASAPLGTYSRRAPEKTVLYEAIRANLETFGHLQWVTVQSEIERYPF